MVRRARVGALCEIIRWCDENGWVFVSKKLSETDVGFGRAGIGIVDVEFTK